MRLSGQIAVVTGAGRGIGRAIALAQAGEGAKVALLARTASEIEAVAKEIAAEGGNAQAFAVDIVDLDSVVKAFAQIESDLGSISLLANNAAAFGAIGPIWTIEPEAWWRDVVPSTAPATQQARPAFSASRSVWQICSPAPASSPSRWTLASCGPQ